MKHIKSTAMIPILWTLSFLQSQAVKWSDCLNKRAIIYLHPNLAECPETRHLYATRDIPMGTPLIIEKPWIVDANYDSEQASMDFVKSYVDLYACNENVLFKNYINNEMPVIASNEAYEGSQELLKAIPKKFQARYTKMCGAGFENDLYQTIQHLSWKNSLYSTVPFIKMGLYANVAMFEHDIDSNEDTMVVVATADIKKYEILSRPLHFMANMLLTTNSQFDAFDISQWREITKYHLADREKRILDLYWDSFVFVYDEFEKIRYDDVRANLSALLASSEYNEVLSQMYEGSFGQEMVIPLIAMGETINSLREKYGAFRILLDFFMNWELKTERHARDEILRDLLEESGLSGANTVIQSIGGSRKRKRIISN